MIFLFILIMCKPFKRLSKTLKWIKRLYNALFYNREVSV